LKTGTFTEAATFLLLGATNKLMNAHNNRSL